MLISRIRQVSMKIIIALCHSGESWAAWSFFYTRMNLMKDRDLKTLSSISLRESHFTANPVKIGSFCRSYWFLHWIFQDSWEDWEKSQCEKVTQTGEVCLLSSFILPSSSGSFLAFSFPPSITEIKPRSIPQ